MQLLTPAHNYHHHNLQFQANVRFSQTHKVSEDQKRPKYMYKSKRNEERVFPTDFADSQKAKPNVEMA